MVGALRPNDPALADKPSLIVFVSPPDINHNSSFFGFEMGVRAKRFGN
jgi:hypothetical protein